MRSPTYPSDLSDAQWALIEPLLPAAHWDGRKEKHPRRDIVDAILYVNQTGCAWRYLPVDFPPWQTVYWHFQRWEEHRVTDKIVNAVRRRLRRDLDRDPEPSAAVMDSQTVDAADTVGAGSRGHDAGKKINGRKRFIITDTQGLPLTVMVRPGGVQDRAGATSLLLGLVLLFSCRTVFADQGFSGRLVTWARDVPHLTLHIIGKPAGQRGFQVHPRRWVIERTNGWLLQRRRLARDYEHHPTTSEALIRWAAIHQMTRHITRRHPATRPGPRPLEHL
ncbi:IS5 family transposase [Actinocorallia sp. API 0066]|uniref:IS5 family transposase n=1 Tax=Actinocorallia sp. API 0066 TaxID=2896846 RepID=UPI001E478E9B|nr:IS5 family transposase [Actinocorallia sp. API 0066]MCD0453813.1 IS5 family transposase [Actinocorallia sp. API 0066]